PAHAAKGVADRLLARAAREATLDQIDSFRKDCKDNRTVEEWLTDTLGDTAGKVTWRGGKCVLVIPISPLDSGTPWCGRAEFDAKKDRAPGMIEVFFENPVKGKPGKPFAFRATMKTKDGDDYMRATYDFQVSWKEKYRDGYKVPANQDCND